MKSEQLTWEREALIASSLWWGKDLSSHWSKDPNPGLWLAGADVMRVGGVQLQLISRLLLLRAWYETLHLDINKESLMSFYFTLITDSTLIHVKCLHTRLFWTQTLPPDPVTIPIFSPGLQTGLRPALASSRLKSPPLADSDTTRKIDKEGNCRLHSRDGAVQE